MNDWNCEAVQDHLPEWASGTLADARSQDAVARHLEACDDCRDTADLILGMAALPHPAAPDDLAQRVVEAVRGDAAAARRTGVDDWAPSAAGTTGTATERGLGAAGARRGLSMRTLALAASLVVAVGTPWVVRQMQSRGPLGSADSGWGIDADSGGDSGAGVEAAELAQVAELLPPTGLGDGNVIAGALMLDDLSDAELMAILEELER